MMFIKSWILGAVIFSIADSRIRVLRQAAPPSSGDSNQTGHSYVNTTGLDANIQQWLNVINSGEGGINYGAAGITQGDNESAVITSGAGATRLLNGSTDGSSASSNASAVGVQSYAKGNSTGQEFNGTQWATADGLALSHGSGQSAAGISGAVQTMDKNISNPFGVNSLTGGSQSDGSGDTNSVVQSSQTLNFSSILAELTTNALAESVNKTSAAVQGAFDGVNGKSIDFNINSSSGSNTNSSSQVNGSLSVANDTHIVSASVSGSGEGNGTSNVSSNAGVSDNSGGIEVSNKADSTVDVGHSAVDSESDVTRISNGTNQVSNLVSGEAFGSNRSIIGDGTVRQFDENNNTQTMASGNGQSEGSGNINGNSSITALTNLGQPNGAAVLVVTNGNSATDNNGTAALGLRNTGQLDSTGGQQNTSGEVVSNSTAFGDFGNTTGDAQLILDNTGSTGVGDQTAFAQGANYANVGTNIGLNMQDVFGNRTTTLNGSATAIGDEVLAQSQQGLADSNGVNNMGSSQTANSSSEKSASSTASAQLVLPKSLVNINFGKRRKRSASLVEGYKFTRVCLNSTTEECQLYLVETSPDTGTTQLTSMSQDQFISVLTAQTVTANNESDTLTNMTSISSSNVLLTNSSSGGTISAITQISSQTSSSGSNGTLFAIAQTASGSSSIFGQHISASVQQTLINNKAPSGQLSISTSAFTQSNGSHTSSVAMVSENGKTTITKVES